MAGAQTFLFADLAGFTALTEAHGDEDAAELAGEFFACVRELLEARGGEEVKTIGDAVMLRHPDAAGAIALGLAIVDAVDARDRFPEVRVGMSTGSAIERQGDWFGAAVNLAARISGVAGGGEVLLSEQTQRAAGEGEGIEFERHGELQLRNLAEPVNVYRAQRVGERPAGLPVDPVCRMTIAPHASVGELVHDGVRYHFCSLRCVARFAESPDSFARQG